MVASAAKFLGGMEKQQKDQQKNKTICYGKLQKNSISPTTKSAGVNNNEHND